MDSSIVVCYKICDLYLSYWHLLGIQKHVDNHGNVHHITAKSKAEHELQFSSELTLLVIFEAFFTKSFFNTVPICLNEIILCNLTAYYILDFHMNTKI